jgi:hypothetical protein
MDKNRSQTKLKKSLFGGSVKSLLLEQQSPKLYFVIEVAGWTLQDNVLEFSFDDCLA